MFHHPDSCRLTSDSWPLKTSSTMRSTYRLRIVSAFSPRKAFSLTSGVSEADEMTKS